MRFGEVFLIHRALPEICLEEVDTSTDFFGHRLSAPILIEAITGGFREAEKINSSLAEAAEALGLAIGVGSQSSRLGLYAQLVIKPIAIGIIPTIADISGEKGTGQLKVHRAVRTCSMLLAAHIVAVAEGEIDGVWPIQARGSDGLPWKVQVQGVYAGTQAGRFHRTSQERITGEQLALNHHLTRSQHIDLG